MKRVLRVVLWVVLGLFLVSSVGGYWYFRQAFSAPPNQLMLSRERAEIPFRWTAGDFNGKVEPYWAMLLPVTLRGQSRQFYMQFDLGAPSTVFYRSKIESIQAHCSGCLRIGTEPNGSASLEDLAFSVGDLPITAGRARLRKVGDAGIDWSRPDGVEVIGTVGSDLIDGRVAILDYAKGTIVLDTHIPEQWVVPARMPRLQFKERRVLLSAVVAGKDTTILLDTGSSAFELLTDPDTWTRLAAPGAKEEVVPVKSWDKTLHAHRVATGAMAALGGAEIPLSHVTYIEGTSFVQNMLMRVSGMGGMTGNRLFIGKALLLDLKQGRYAVLDSETRKLMAGTAASVPALDPD